MTEAEMKMAIESVNKALKRLGLDPWPDGRSVTDGKRPWEQHVEMVLSALKAELEEAQAEIKAIRDAAADVLSFSGRSVLTSRANVQFAFDKLRKALKEDSHKKHTNGGS